MSEKSTIICDIETYPNYLLIAFKQPDDGKVVVFEETADGSRTFDRDKLAAVMMRNRIVTFNGQNFDVPIIFKAVQGGTFADAKRACDIIINGNVRYWQAEDALGVTVPRALDHIDLIEPQPNAWASLKTLNGRLHGKRMQDLPYPPDQELTPEQIDEVRDYCINDLDATILLWEALTEPLALRVALGEQYGMDFRSKSDSQIGEAIIKKRVEQQTGERPYKVATPGGSTFGYKVPEWMAFDNAELRDVVNRLRTTEFIVQGNGKVALPGWLDGKQLTIGETTYAMGIGGLHSTEKNRAVSSDGNHFLRDYDVASYYPAIILGSGLYPKACGPAFLDVYRGIREERIAAKTRVREIDDVEIPRLRKREILDDTDKKAAKDKYKALQAERSLCKVKDSGGKIQLNGVFGKLGSPYSVLYAPHLMIAVTLTGQLSLLMLIDRAERAGIPVVSANTDGVVFRCPYDMEDTLAEVTAQWERDTGFELEATDYEALYSQSVNTYIAVKPGGKAKRKGVLANPRAEGDLRTQMMNSPSMNVCSDAATAFLARGVPIEETIYGCKDIRDFVTVVNVRGGGKWREEYLGKVVRYIWSTDGDEILYKDPNPTTGNFKKVSKTDGSRPLMELPDDGDWPEDIDYDRYIEAARQILVDVGFHAKVAPQKKARVYKYSRVGWAIASLVAV